MEGNSSAQDLENRVRQQVDQILSEIRGTPPAARRPGESLSFEDVAVATARAVIPALLVDLPLEMERVIRQAPDGVGGKSEERVELLRLIVTRLASEWTELADRLAGRLDTAVEASGDAEAVKSLKEEVLRRFRVERPWAVLLGGLAPSSDPGRRKSAPPVAVAEELAEKIAESVSRRVEASRALAPAPAPALPADLAERVAEVTANTLKSGVIGDLRKDLAEIHDVAARSEAIRAVLRAELERALGTMSQSAFRPDEIRMISTHIAHTLGGTLTNWIFGPPRPEERVRAPRASRSKAARRRPKRAAPAKAQRSRAKAAPRRRARKVTKPSQRKAAPKPEVRKAISRPKVRKAVRKIRSKPAPRPRRRKSAPKPKARKKAAPKVKARKTARIRPGKGAPKKASVRKVSKKAPRRKAAPRRRALARAAR
jgi:hypothetical protein